MKQDLLKILHQFMNRKLSEAEKQKLEADIEMKDLMAIANIAEQLNVPEQKTKAEAWETLQNRINTATEKPVRQLWQFSKQTVAWIGVAASIMLLVGFYLFFNNSPTLYETQNGQQLAVFLPDGSEVTLNADSKLSFVESDWQKERKVNLQGEAFFKVKKGSNFSVITTQATVEVLGTSFNVFARNKSLDVACFTGKVRVGNKNNKTILTPGKACKLTDNQAFTNYQFNEENKAKWSDGKFYFNAEPLNLVFEELERQYDVKLEIPELSDRTYTGFFTNQDIEEALELICTPMDLTYEITPQKIFISN